MPTAKNSKARSGRTRVSLCRKRFVFCAEDIWIGAAGDVGYHIFVDLVINGI